jgi:hypothetical protein
VIVEAENELHAGRSSSVMRVISGSADAALVGSG